MTASTYEDQEQGLQIDPGAIWRMVKRRFWFFAIPAVLVSALALVVAKALPPVYTSTGTIIIEQPNVPPDLIDSTVTSLAAERIEIIRRRFIATDNLISLIRQHDLYPERRQQLPLTQVAAAMRSSINVTLIEQARGRSSFTVAFVVGFEYRNGAKAKAIADELVSWYLSENARTRQERAQETADFLRQETAAAERDVERLEEEIESIKREYAGSLPDERDRNQAELAQLNRDLRDINFRLEALRDERTALVGRLESISQAGGQAGGSSEAATVAEMLEQLRSDRVSLSTTFTEIHPDIIQIDRQIAQLEARLAELPPAPNTSANDAFVSSITSRAEIERILAELEREISATQRSREATRADIEGVESALDQTTLISEEYQAAVREYQNAVEDFNVLRRKVLEAEMGASLELNQKAERFTLVDAPQAPAAPDSPNRPLVALGGIVVALGLGVASMLAIEFVDSRIRSARKLEQLIGVPPLVLIPEITTRREQARRWFVRGVTICAVVAACGASLWYVHTRVTPLDLLLLKIERQVQSQIGALGL
ncbi:MAG: GumC family protein [Kiloniellales bacterium]